MRFGDQRRDCMRGDGKREGQRPGGKVNKKIWDKVAHSVTPAALGKQRQEDA